MKKMVRAYMRAWYANGEKPKKVLNPETGRMHLPFKFKLLEVTVSKCQENDVPLVDGRAAEKLIEALRPLAALLHEEAVGSHGADQPDSQPVFAINRATITLGDLRRARAALAEFDGVDA